MGILRYASHLECENATGRGKQNTHTHTHAHASATFFSKLKITVSGEPSQIARQSVFCYSRFQPHLVQLMRMTAEA